MRVPEGVRTWIARCRRIIVFWLWLLLITAGAGDLYDFGRLVFPRRDARAALPNYPDEDEARQIFADAKKTIEEYAPFVVWQRQPLSTQTVNIDTEGRRVHRLGRDGGRRSIGFFGGSGVWGTGVADDETIPAIFDQLTEGYQVWNYGEGGQTSRQNLARLVNLINTRRMPETVVFYEGFNDVYVGCNLALTDRLNGSQVERKLRGVLSDRPPGGHVYSDVVLPPIAFFRRIVGEKRFRRDVFVCHDDPVRAEQVAEAFVRNWEMARTLVLARGGRFFGFLQPVAYVGNPRVDHVELNPARLPEARSVFPLIRAKLEDRAASWAADMTHAFDGDEYIYIDHVHVSRRGNEIVARQVLERIEGEG